jgi:hypothetical protein
MREPLIIKTNVGRPTVTNGSGASWDPRLDDNKQRISGMFGDRYKKGPSRLPLDTCKHPRCVEQPAAIVLASAEAVSSISTIFPVPALSKFFRRAGNEVQHSPAADLRLFSGGAEVNSQFADSTSVNPVHDIRV